MLLASRGGGGRAAARRRRAAVQSLLSTAARRRQYMYAAERALSGDELQCDLCEKLNIGSRQHCISLGTLG